MSTPTNLQTQSAAVQWTNGIGLVTGSTLSGLFATIIAIFATLGTWSAAGVYTPSIPAATVTGAELAPGAVVANLGFTPNQGAAAGVVQGPYGALTFNQASGPSQFFPVYHPSSQFNNQAYGHYIPWTDENVVWHNDTNTFQSDDPSALLQNTLTGTPVVGDVVHLCFTWSGHSAPECLASTAGRTTVAQMASDIMAAAQADTTLFTAPGGDTTKPILSVNTTGCLAGQFCIDWNAQLQPFVVVQSVTNTSATAGTETYNFAASCASASTVTSTAPNGGCPPGLDNNPTIFKNRGTIGFGLPNNSQVSSVYYSSNDSRVPTQSCCTTTYFLDGVVAANTTIGAIAGSRTMLWPTPDDQMNYGITFGPGGIWGRDNTVNGGGANGLYAGDPGHGSFAMPLDVIAGRNLKAGGEVDSVSASGNAVMRLLGLDGNSYIGNSSPYGVVLNFQNSNAFIGATLDTNGNLKAVGAVAGASIYGTGTPPTLAASTGTVTGSAGFNDTHGTLTPSAAQIITVTFGNLAYANPRDCTVTAQNGSVPAYSTTARALSITAAATAKITYHCMGS